MRNPLVFLFTIAAAAFSCSVESGSERSADEEKNAAGKMTFTVDTLSTDLTAPWGMAFLPNGDMLITEKSGELKVFSDGRIQAETISGVPEVMNQGQGGLLDIETHPDYENNGWLYFSYSEPAQGGSNTAVMRARLQNNQLVDKEKIFKAQPDTEMGHHFGCKLQFDNDGYLFFGVGDRGEMQNAQKLDNHCGKIYRLHDDGAVPDDNPFVGVENAQPEIFSYGHRNPQGMALHPETGMIWAHEHGPQGGDEINIIQPAKNYGWPEITYGINYDGSIITDDTARAGMEQPLIYWVPSIAPCGMTFVTGDRYPDWKGDLLVGSLKFRYLHYCDVEGNKIVRQERLLEDIGRVRDVEMSPDGYIYVLTEAPGQLLRITPTTDEI